MSATDPIREFARAMADHGLTPPDNIEADGTLHRFRSDGDRYPNAWYVLHLDGCAAGAFGSWRLGISERWSQSGQRPSAAERLRIESLIAVSRHRAQVERQQKHAQTAEQAREIWAASAPADASHPYLRSKQVSPTGLRANGSTLLVPLTDLNGILHNLQRIYPAGQKRFLAGGRITGLCALLGKPTPAGSLMICEGWATAATLHAIYQAPVLAAMNCGNLCHVAAAARNRWPSAPIIVCGDDDRKTPGNPGRTYALKAASQIGGKAVFPDFQPHEIGSDFNDLALLRGQVAA